MEQQQKRLQQTELNAFDEMRNDEHYIGSYQHAPAYMKDNQHITHGYRINFTTTKKIIKSLFMVHNESVNIWSHCIPALFIAITIILTCLIISTSDASQYIKQTKYPMNYLFEQHLVAQTEQIERWPIWVFVGSALICLLTSTVFHLFYPMSKKTYILTNRFDYAGVNFLISGSSFPIIYYGLFCHKEFVLAYLISVSIIAVLCFAVCLFQWIHKAGHEKYKAMLFGGFGLSMLVPLTHIFINNVILKDDTDNFNFIQALPFYILLGVSYLLGLYIYTIRCPERNNPGKYNICGHSHQIWHVMVILGIIFTYFGSQKTYQMRKNSLCPT